MQIDKNKKKQQKTIVIVLSILLVLTALFATTYSLFYTESVAANPSDYSTGLLSIEAKSKSDNIVLESALPMEDSEGIETTPYVFTIKNNGNVDYQFDIKLLSTNDDPISSQYIKLKVDDSSATTLSTLTNSIIKSNVILRAKESIDITLRVWLDINTPNTEMGKSFNSKIVIDGQAIYTETNYDALEGAAKKIVEIFESDYVYNTTFSGKTIHIKYDTEHSIMEDLAGNIRYYGQNPNNYVDIGDRDGDNHVILWRIIGVFGNKLKLIRNESIGQYSWDTSSTDINSGYGINQWGPSKHISNGKTYSGADLMKLLNPGFDNNQDLDENGNSVLINNSLYYNSQSGMCYNNTNNTAIACDFTNTGLSSSVHNKIATVTWNLGSSASFLPAGEVYNNERGKQTINDPSDDVERTATVMGKIGLAYPSDYGYATDLSKCEYRYLYDYNNPVPDNTYACRTNDWMYYTFDKSNTWFLTPVNNSSYYSQYVNPASIVNVNSPVGRPYNVFPVLYLIPNADIDMSHDGSSTDPYVIND